MARETGPLALRRVTGAHTDKRLVEWNTHAPRHVGHPGKRRAQIALHVHGQRFQRRDVDDAAAFSGSPVGWLQHQPVQAPEERCQRLACARRSKDQRTLTARDHRPAHPLRRGRRVEDGLEPLRRHRVKAGKGIGNFGRIGLGRGHAALKRLAQRPWRRQSEKAEIRDQGSEIGKSSEIQGTFEPFQLPDVFLARERYFFASPRRATLNCAPANKISPEI